MTQEHIKQIEQAFKHGDNLVFQIGERVFVSDTILKHRKQGTIEMQECSEIDIACFNPDGSYDGDVLSDLYNIILEDHYSELDNIIETQYYEDELVEIYKLHQENTY